jgi:hypothetical protein
MSIAEQARRPGSIRMYGLESESLAGGGYVDGKFSRTIDGRFTENIQAESRSCQPWEEKPFFDDGLSVPG